MMRAFIKNLSTLAMETLIENLLLKSELTSFISEILDVTSMKSLQYYILIQY